MAVQEETLTALLAPVRIDVTGLRATAGRGDRQVTLLHDVTFSLKPGELVAIVGGSGAGKTTLLNSLAGLRPVERRMIRYNGADLAANAESYRTLLGYVPQDDIVHTELTVERTLIYAAKLRLPPGTDAAERAGRVAAVMQELGLTERAHQRVASLSGGQRKRTSIGAELLTNPGVFFLDEPTSGLDPATGREMMRTLRRLASDGSTVVLTTHAPHDIASCDRVVFLTRGGYLAFAGPPDDALRYFSARTFDAIYELLESERTPEEWGRDWSTGAPSEGPRLDAGGAERHPVPKRPTVNQFRQWLFLTERNFEILGRNWLTLAILAGAPVMVIAMFAVLFKPGAFAPSDPSPSAVIMILFWVAFGGFFFGLTYGLLQICTEFPIFHRERLVNLKILPYVASKMAVLVPILLVVVAGMLGVLRVLDRLPSASGETYLELFVTLLLDGLAAIAIGLLASAAVSRTEQATLVLPMLCFPQVLFSGAILPVPVMAGAGKVVSYLMSDKWAFDALGKSLEVNALLENGNSPLGPPLRRQYEDTFSGGLIGDWLILAAFTVVFLAGTCLILARKKSRFT